jgi:hypothetical protein
LIQHSPDLYPQVAHRDISNSVQGRLIKINTRYLPPLPMFLTPYSPDVSPCDFFLFGGLKRKLKGENGRAPSEIRGVTWSAHARNNATSLGALDREITANGTRRWRLRLKSSIIIVILLVWSNGIIVRINRCRIRYTLNCVLDLMPSTISAFTLLLAYGDKKYALSCYVTVESVYLSRVQAVYAPRSGWLVPEHVVQWKLGAFPEK